MPYVRKVPEFLNLCDIVILSNCDHALHCR